ncbi:MAG: HD domain-containing protein [Clostridia bacterium]|nr:HD domain-containing protein [Clostridia bacterium]
MSNVKIFRDTIHGYIEIEKDIVNSIIDTALFQRLRRIEQTSMRCLYPAARHDRFIHSIGTFHLAKKISTNLSQKFKELTSGKFIFDKEYFSKLQFNLELAALLHDVGHSPFSHTLEDYFKLEKRDGEVKINKQLKEALSKCVDNDVYVKFCENFANAHPSPHEIISAIISITEFKDAIQKLCEARSIDADYDFIIRAITGTMHDDIDKALDNCFIRLLNSSAIDVDKLDYITRDSEISGYDNVKVDTERLITSITPWYFTNDKGNEQLVLVYDKTALSVIQNVVTCRNALYTWIYSHHKVQYETFLISNAIKEIAKQENPGNPNLFITQMFCLENIVNNCLCDDDIWCLFKKHKDIPCIKEILDRGNQKKAVWKSFVEFKEIFPERECDLKLGDFSVENFKLIAGSNALEAEEFKKYLYKYKDLNIEAQIIKTSIKLSSIDRSAILILLNGHIYSYNTLLEELNPNLTINSFLYIYVDKTIKSVLDNEDFVKYIKDYPKFRMMPPV